MANNNYCIILTTFAKLEEAKPLIDNLLSKQLAACVQCFPIQSHYTWKGKVEHNDEVVLFIKTASSRYQEVEKEIKDYHPYETPEIVQIPITNGSQEYLSWISDNVGLNKNR
ncbi:MAG: divalent-cation tolerance protein CutA [Prevotellaceae bacterium]|jgi:periplasmic divalent cation tolerance protein|nr:divalent-cation tolerance protein CutA [Prevotellaceae bacterium]